LRLFTPLRRRRGPRIKVGRRNKKKRVQKRRGYRGNGLDALIISAEKRKGWMGRGRITGVTKVGCQAGDNEEQLGMPAHSPLPKNLSFPPSQKTN